MRFLGYWLRGRLVEAIGRADGAIGRFAMGRFALGRPAGYGLWAIGERVKQCERRKVRGEGYLFLMVSNPCPKTPLTLA